MTRKGLYEQILNKRSFLCVGLDTDIDKIPASFKKKYKDPVFEFNKQIIDATRDFCVAYKINTAFYEARGEQGWKSLHKTVNYIPKTFLKIADVKKGDIGNTTEAFAKAYFKTLNFDAVTISPYMGEDAVLPFLEYPGKWVIVLGLTSNPSSKDFQLLKVGKEYLFEIVAKKIASWGTPENTMVVVGATQPTQAKRIRKILPDHFFLVPGIGAQGGDLSKFAAAGANKEVGLLANASRSIIYASTGKDYLSKARKAAYQIQREMELILQENGLVD